jgi:hypothetical protein
MTKINENVRKDNVNSEILQHPPSALGTISLNG